VVQDAIIIPTYRASLVAQHLWATGRALLQDPLLVGFTSEMDTSLANVGIEAFYRGFYLLADYLYDPNEEGYAPNYRKDRWCKLAVFVFWWPIVGRPEALRRMGLYDEVLEAAPLVRLVGDPVLRSREQLLRELLAG